MHTVWQDVRYGLRVLLRSPGFTLVAVLTLALGIGANTAVFSVINGFLLRPLPGKDNDRLLVIAQHQSKEDYSGPISYLDYLEYRSHSDAYSDMAAYTNGLVGLAADNRSDRIIVQFVTGNFFSFLGLQPAAGRFILPEEGEKSGAERLVVLGYRYWQRNFAGSPAVIGKGVKINGKPCTIIGVAPEALIGPFSPIETDAYISLSSAGEGFYPGFYTQRDQRSLHVFARPKPSVSPSQAQASLQVIASQLAQQYPSTNADTVIDVFPEHFARPEPDAARSTPLVAAVFLAMVALVTIVTCINVANLMLVRASTRFKEMAIRASLGAGRLRIFRQLLTESLVLSLMGGLAGAVLGWWCTRMLGSIRFPIDLPLRVDFSFDWRVFTYVGVIALLCGFVVGLVPAWRASRMNLNAALREGGRSGAPGSAHNLMRNALVVVQVAGTLVVLICAGLFVRSLRSAETIELGFHPDGVLNLCMDTTQLGYDEPRSIAFYRAIKERTLATAGVESASFAYSVPFGYYNNGASVWNEAQRNLPANEVPSASYNAVDEDYFHTLQIPILRGRSFTQQDQASTARVVLINETMAAKLWPGQDPLGHHFIFEKPNGPPVEIVGVVKNGRYRQAMEEERPYFFVPMSQNYNALRVLHVRATGDPLALAAPLQQQIHSLEPNLPIYDVQSLRHALGGVNGFFLPRVGAVFASILGGLGLLVAVVGVYGVISYAVSLRTHEFGIRIALGAQRRDILRMVIRQGLLLVGGGLLIGLALSAALTRFLKDMLFQISALDPFTYIIVLALLTAISLAACYVPARRATKVDPLTALRYE